MEPERPVNNRPLYNAPFNQHPTVIRPETPAPVPVFTPTPTLTQQQPQPQPQPAIDNQTPSPTKSKTGLIIAIVAGVELLIIIGLAAAVIASSGSKAAPRSGTGGTTVQTLGPQAATSKEIQFTNDSISQDISSLNDDKDFPAAKLNDQALGL